MAANPTNPGARIGGVGMNDRPWLAHYDPGVPHTLVPYPDRTLLDFLDDAVRERPTYPFLLFKGRRFSWLEVDRLSSRFAAALVKERVHPGDRVALVLPNCPQMVIAQLGIWKAGAIAVPLNPLYTEQELEGAVTQVGAELAVVLTLCYSHIKKIQSRTAIRRVIATSIKDYLSPHLALLFTLTKEKKEGHRVTLTQGDVWLMDLLRRAPRERPPVAVKPDDTSLLLFTGGTTGTPKAAIFTHRQLLIAAMQIHVWCRSVLRPWQSASLLLTPLSHIYGNWVLAAAILGHGSVALVPNPRDLNDVLKTIRRTRPVLLPAVPTFYAALLEHPWVKAGKVDLTCFKICSSGAAPLMAETRTRMKQVTGAEVIEGYGLTESCAAATFGPLHGLKKPGSAGIPLPDIEIRIVDAATGREVLPANEVGEISLRGPQTIRDYWQSPPEIDSMLRDGWLYTGDLGYMDEDGYLFIVDRKKDLIKASGFQVWPREVEEIIATHPAVAQVGVAGVPDPQRGEVVKAWVVLKPAMQGSADDIRAHCRQHLAAYKVPREVEFRAALPMTLVGKVLRRELRAEARAANRQS